MDEAETRVRVMLDRLAQLETIEERQLFFIDNPGMAADRVRRIAMEDPKTGVFYLTSFTAVGGVVTRTSNGGITHGLNPGRYPVANGPIEKLWKLVEDRQKSQAEAIVLATRPSFADNLSYGYVKALCDRAWKLLRSDHRLALQRQRLVVEASEAQRADRALADVDEVWGIRKVAGHAWLDCCSTTLTQIPDGRLLAQARELGLRLIADAETRGDQKAMGILLGRIGVLFLDPYTASRDLSNRANYDLSISIWRNRLVDEVKVGDGEGDAHMPEPAEALETAEGFLRRAMELKSGSLWGATATALIQGLLARAMLGAALDKKEVLTLIDRSLAVLVPGEDDERIVRLKGWRQSLANKSNAKPGSIGAQLDRLLQTPKQHLIDEMGARGLGDAIRQVLLVLQSEDNPEAGLKLIGRYREEIDAGSLSDDQREDIWRTELFLLRDWNQREGKKLLAKKQPAEVARLLTFALTSGAKDEEEKGQAAYAQAIELNSRLEEDHAKAMIWLRAVLSTGAGRNHFNARSMPAAAHYYVEALEHNLSLRLRSKALDTLQRLQDTLDLCDAEETAGLIKALEKVALTVEITLGAAGTARLQTLYRLASSKWAKPGGKLGVDGETLFGLFRLAKGARLSSCLDAFERYDWREDPEAVRRLTLVKTAQKRLDPGWRDEENAVVDPELALAGALGESEFGSGSDAREEFENLRRSFDEYTTRQTVEMADWAGPPHIDHIKSKLDSRTVLFDYYLGLDHERRAALHIICISAEQAYATWIPLDGLPWPLTEEGAPIEALSALTQLVRETRVLVQSLAGFDGDVSEEAQPRLKLGWVIFFGVFTEALRQFSEAGCDHLCIVPHQAAHFFPFHLLTNLSTMTDEPLANDWVVTYLPSMELLVRLRPREDRTGVMSVGLDFADSAHPHLRVIEEGPVSAREIAARLGGAALINEEATEANVLAALENANVAHIFTHGEHCIYAAAFHALYLASAPEKGDDGVLEAYEVAPLDLSGLDFVSLSACESALGRFDAGDNLRGLPASFFLAGARTIVGALWPVSPEAARFFFADLYSAFGEGAEPRDAFARAQRATRARFPEYREWGAFYYSGCW